MPKKTADYARILYNPGESLYVTKGEMVRVKHIVSLAGDNNNILDLGCYDGTIAKKIIDNGNKVYGIEANPQAAAIAESKGVRVKIQDIESDFSYPASFFDVVVAGEIIEHILDTDFFIDEIKRVLKPGGFVVLSTPNAASLGRRIFLLLGKNPYFEASLGYPPFAHAGHIRFFTKNLLLDFLKYKGFKIINLISDVINFDSAGRISSSLAAGLFPAFGRSLIVRAQVDK